MFPLSTQNVVIIDEVNHPSFVHVEESVSIDSDTSAGSYDISTTGNTINSSTIDTFNGEGISPIYSISPPVSNICRAPFSVDITPNILAAAETVPRWKCFHG